MLFADIVGFTAWSSMREPSQVFTLLESLYSAFDDLATRRKVFKVETIGDCYVAVCGVPEANKNHASVMVRFARDCLSAMHVVLHNLTVELGPSTTDLGMRIGLHSGSVTAGVLRTNRARFQLFGDTVNTASRMETTGEKNRIHVSEATAELLRTAGKGNWISPRESLVDAKGKGSMQTYWVYTKGETTKSSGVASSTGSDTTDEQDGVNDVISQAEKQREHLRVVDWTVEVLQSLLKEVIARRRSMKVMPDDDYNISLEEEEIENRRVNPIEEVEDTFRLPKYTPTKEDVDPSDIVINDEILKQLREFVMDISDTYNANPFHNFSHANHVTLSVVKLLKRIVAPEEDECEGNDKAVHDHTYGITSDPLTQLTVVLAALIHDVGHRGVPNSRLVEDRDRLAAIYKGKSVAEQNSVDVAWAVLMDERFKDLRRVIYTTTSELRRFRQMLVHTVLATDIMDKELSAKRKERWHLTFEKPEAALRSSMTMAEDADRKATIVIEYLMQASDVAHTMQHWHIYRKWNSRLFREVYAAYKSGNADKDPSEGWYQGELGFFDFYIIPLAKKLKTCGVFGVSSDEYLNYAVANRKEWASKGEEIVQELVAEVSKGDGNKK